MKNTEKIAKLISKVFSIIVPVDESIIVFESYIGRQFSDNPRAIYNYIREKYPQYKCYWSIDKNSREKFEGYDLQLIEKGTIRWFFMMARARFWVSNSRIPLWVIKSKKTIYLQTWHGTPLKKLALDMDMTHSVLNNPDVYKMEFDKETDRWDYLISPNNYSTAIFKKCFNFNNIMLETGYPRNDYLVNANNEKASHALKIKLGLPLDKKIILYAPTWRDSTVFNSPIDVQEMKNNLGDDYTLIVRLHYLVKKSNDLFEDSDFVKNVTNYNDISELYLVSDLLITDYSSVFFDYSVLKRPMIFHCFDLENYKNELRGFYFDFERQAPGPIVKTTDELIQAIRKSSEQESSAEFFKDFLEWEDGNATRRVVERVFDN